MSLPNLAMPGGVIEKSLFICDRDGNRLEDVSDLYDSGTVRYREDLGGGVPTQFTANLIGPEKLEPLQHLISPYLKITYDDGRVLGIRRFGSFLTGQPDTTISQTVAQFSYPCEDLTAILRDATFDKVYKIGIGVNVGTAIEDLIEYGGLTQHRIPATTRTTGIKRSFMPGDSVLAKINDLCKAVGWWPVWMTSQAIITTQQRRPLSQSQPVRAYSDADYIGSISDRPTRGQVGNVVVVRQERSDQPTRYAKRRNTDLDSPISIPNVGREILYTGAPVDARDAESQSDVDDLADALMEEAKSYERTVSMTALPDFDVMGAHRVLDLDITTQGANFDGRYWLRGWEIGMSPKDAVMKLTLNRMVRFRRGEDL